MSLSTTVASCTTWLTRRPRSLNCECSCSRNLLWSMYLYDEYQSMVIYKSHAIVDYVLHSKHSWWIHKVPVSDAAIGTVELDEIEERRHAPVRRRVHLDGAPPHRANRLPHKVHVHLLRVFLQLRQDLFTGIETTGFSSEIRTKLRDWAVGQAGACYYSQAALSSNDSKTL